MTTLAIMATYEKKRLKCYGTVAAGEHVAVTVTDGAQWIGEGKALRLRVLFGPDTVGVFPFADGDAWTATGTQNADAACELNLNTLQAEKYLKHGGTCLWILDDVENHTLYATGKFDVLPWPKRRGIDEPIDLDGYPLLLDEIKDLKEAFEEYQRTVAQMLATKQDTIFDLATIRSGAAAGATAVQPSQIARFVDDAEYKAQYGEQNKPAILFKHGTDVIVALDATPFVKDGVVSSVAVVGGNLVITFNTDSGKQPISIPLTDIFDPDNYYTKTDVNGLLAGKASKSDVDPLLFARYYPDGSVKSAAEFTQGIKYNNPDTANRTITVKPFCNTGTATKDNSNLRGRVVIPPFVDAQGNGYISDDGTRYKVVGVGGFSGVVGSDKNTNLTAIVAPNTVTTTGANAFANCTSLTTVSLPAVTTIDNGVFVGCTSLNSLSLFAVERVYAFSFLGCTSLASVDFGDTPRSSVPSLDAMVFDTVSAPCKIIVPYAQYDAWKAASGWRDLPQQGFEFVRHAEKADKPTTFTAGNLAALDASGNPTDSQIPAANVAVKSELPYALVTKTITNGAVSLDDCTINAVAVSSSLASLTVNFPTATSGKARDFGLRLTVASGITTAPQIVLPQGVTCENADGTAPEIGADGAATILYFTETASGVFLVKGEVVTAIS